MNILVIDVGTSSMRGILYNEHAEKLSVYQDQYEVIYLENGYAEQDPEDWRTALCEIVKRQAAYAREHKLEISGIALTAQRSSVIPVNRKGEPLRTAIMWLDKRNSDICKGLEGSRDMIFAKTGAGINAVFSGSRMTWIRQNQPDIYSAAYKLLTIADYLAFLMTGEFKTDHTYGSRSSLMNLRKREWDDELLDLYQIEKEKLCELIAPGDVHGTTCESFSKATGIGMGIPVISAGGDQQCAAIGQGVLSEGSMELTTGTGAFALGFAAHVPDHLEADIICGAHAVRGAYVLESSMLACSSLYDWYRKNFYAQADAQGDPKTEGKSPYETMNREIEEAVPGTNGCIALPYFQGRGTPDWNNKATGLFAGITLQTTKADMARALLESIAMEACNNLKILEKYTGTIKQIFIGGGLTNFKAFNQIQADIYQKELIRYEAGEETSLGAFISAGVTLGLYRDYETAFLEIKKSESFERYIPDRKHQEIYEKKRTEMNRLYECIKKAGE